MLKQTKLFIAIFFPFGLEWLERNRHVQCYHWAKSNASSVLLKEIEIVEGIRFQIYCQRYASKIPHFSV